MHRVAALIGVLVSLTPVACATTVQPGLANAAALSTSPVTDASVHDVIANGRDSCQRGLGAGPLRHQFPPCPEVARPGPAPAPFVIRVAPPEKGFVMP